MRLEHAGVALVRLGRVLEVLERSARGLVDLLLLLEVILDLLGRRGRRLDVGGGLRRVVRGLEEVALGLLDGLLLRLEHLLGGVGVGLRLERGFLGLRGRRVEVLLRETLENVERLRIGRQARERRRRFLAERVVGLVVGGDLSEIFGARTVAGQERVRRDREDLRPEVLCRSRRRSWRGLLRSALRSGALRSTGAHPHRTNRPGRVGRADLAERVEDRVVLRIRAGLIVHEVDGQGRALERGEKIGAGRRIVEVTEHDRGIEVLRRDGLALIRRSIALVAAVLVQALVLEQLVDLGVVTAEDLAQLVLRGRAGRHECAADLNEQLRRAVHRECEGLRGAANAEVAKRVDRGTGDAEEQTELLLERAALLLVLRRLRMRRRLAVDDLRQRSGGLRLRTVELADRADRADLRRDQLLRDRLARDVDQRVEPRFELRLAERIGRLRRAIDRARVRLVDFRQRLGQVGQRGIPACLAPVLLVVRHELRLRLRGRQRSGERDDDLKQADRLALICPGVTECGDRTRVAKLLELGDRSLRFARVAELLGPRLRVVGIIGTAGEAKADEPRQ